MSKPKVNKISARQRTPPPEQGQTVDVIGCFAQGADTPAEPVVTTQAVDPAPAEAAAPAVAELEAPKPAMESKVPRAPRDQRNGITRPAAGKCREVWDTLDALKAEGRELTFEVLRAAVDSKIADATIRTQRHRWKQYSAEKKDGQ